MAIKGTNVICFALAIFALFLLIRMHQQVASFVATIGRIGAGNHPHDQVMGLIALGLVSAIILGLIKIASQNDRNDS